MCLNFNDFVVPITFVVDIVVVDDDADVEDTAIVMMVVKIMNGRQIDNRRAAAFCRHRWEVVLTDEIDDSDGRRITTSS
jgi:hypothetical protein